MRQQFQYFAYCINICSNIHLPTGKLFWCSILRSISSRINKSIGITAAQIYHLYIITNASQHDVLWFQIEMKDLIFMKILQST